MSINSLYPFDRDVLTVKKYGDNIVKVSMLSSCRVSGFEDSFNYVPKSTVNDSKLDNNLSRAKSRVMEFALCNPWKYWCTFTISPEKYDRYNLKAYKKDFSEFIHTLNRSRIEKITYILIPEMHEDGAWHMHGFINGLSDTELKPTGNFGKDGNEYFTWPKYHYKFGFMSLSAIRDLERTAKYSMKYMTKDNSRNVTELGAHLYYASHGLKSAERIYKGHGEFHGEWDWSHPDGYLKIKTLDLRETTLEEYIEVM